MESFQHQFINALLAYATQRGVDIKQLCAASRIDYKALNQMNVVINAQQFDDLWKNLVHLSNDPLVGLHFGESMQLAALGVVGQVVQTSTTVEEALTHACAFVSLVTDVFEMKLEVIDKKKVKVCVIPHPNKTRELPNTFRQLADFLMVFTVHELKGLMLEDLTPMSANFNYPLADAREYARIFRCTISTKNSELSLIFPHAMLGHKLLSANYELQNFLLTKISSWLLPLYKGALQAKIYNYLLANSYLGSPTLEAVAANFSLSRRSLQRKLKEEGVTFLEIVEAARKSLALNFLSSGSYSVKDVSNRLGYNEPSAFVRAFKRWTNTTPTQFQEKAARRN